MVEFARVYGSPLTISWAETRQALSNSGLGMLIPTSATADGIADDSEEIQDAIDAANARGGGDVILDAKTYFLGATLTLYDGVRLRGAGGTQTIFIRTGSYGDTITQSGGFLDIEGIYFVQSSRYVTGDAALTHRLTDASAHIRAIDCQNVSIRRNIIYRMPYGIVLDGCHNPRVDDNWIEGVWDPTVTDLQEGIAGLWMTNTNRYGQLAKIRGNYFSALAGPTRDVTFTDAGTNFVTASKISNIGSKYHILLNSGEETLIEGNYFGRASEVLINITANSATSTLLNTRIVGNFLDNSGSGAVSEQIRLYKSHATSFILNVSIVGNTFNGQYDTMRAIYGYVSAQSGPSAYNVSVAGNTFNAHVACPVFLQGVIGGTVSGNTVTNWNSLGVSPAGADTSFSAGVWAGSQSKFINIVGNTLGGGGNDYHASTGNYCHYGVWITALTADTNRQWANVNAGIITQFSTTPISQSIAGTPVSLLPAVIGSVAQRTDGTAGNLLYVKEGETDAGWVEVRDLTCQDTAANIASIAATINTANKRLGKIVWDTTNNRSMRASGTTAASPWHMVGGGTTVTPA